MINGYYGKADDSIIYYIRKTNSFYIRRRPHIERGANQNNFRSIMANLQSLYPDYYYKQDMSFYLELYIQLPQNKYGAVISWCNLFMKLMFTMAGTLPGIDLKTLTKADIYANNLPCISVKSAVEAGLLPIVKGYERFLNGIRKSSITNYELYV